MRAWQNYMLGCLSQLCESFLTKLPKPLQNKSQKQKSLTSFSSVEKVVQRDFRYFASGPWFYQSKPKSPCQFATKMKIIRLTLSFTDLIEVSSLSEKFQHFSAAVARIYLVRGRMRDSFIVIIRQIQKYKNKNLI